MEAERRREEADRALAELEALTRERDRMQAEAVEAEALRRSDELKTALLRSISHDLRTPLTSIIAGGSALGSETLTAEERAELSEAIVAEGERLSRLVENLLDMSRLEAGKAEPHREPVDLAEVLDAAAQGQGEPGQIRLAIDAELPLVDADAAQLERAFANLLENAVRYGDGRPVSVRSRLVGEQCRRPRGRPGAGHTRARAGADLRALPARRRGRTPARASGWRSPRGSSRPTAARSRSSRCRARARASSSACRRTVEERR